jgi:hypothetical protein
MSTFAVCRVVLYKHGVGYFERKVQVEGDATLTLTFKQAEVSDVLKSLTVLDLDGGHVASVSYDSTKPLEQLLAEVALSIPDQGSLVGLLPQIKGARIAVIPALENDLDSEEDYEDYEGEDYEREEEEDYDEEEPEGNGYAGEPREEELDLPIGIEGLLLGIDTQERQTEDGIERAVLISLLTDEGAVCSFDLHRLLAFRILDEGLRRDLEYYLRTQLSAKKKDSRTFTFFAQGKGTRTVRVSYTLESPVWKATYRILLGEEGKEPLIQGWAVVDNTLDEDWVDVQLSLVSGLPVSFVHDLYTPRYIHRPVVAVQETTGVLPPQVENAFGLMEEGGEEADRGPAFRRKMGAFPADVAGALPVPMAAESAPRSAVSSTPTQVRERKLGDLFEYEIEHPVTIRRNQSALVPIVLRAFKGRPVLLHNKTTRKENPLRCVEFENTTGLTLEGGPVTVLEGGSYVGEAMLDTLKPGEERLVPYAVELGVTVLDNIDSHDDAVHRVVVRDRVLTIFYQRVQQTTYTFHNKSDAEHALYLEHPRQDGEWQLFDTPEPKEVTEHFWRFRLTLPARRTTQFVVRQRLPCRRAQNLLSESGNQLAYWVEQRYLDRKTEQVLRQVVEQQQLQAKNDARVKKLTQEREGIHREQQRIRENLQALGDRPAEKELRERFVRTLNAQEDRLEQIEKEARELAAANDRFREEINRLLAGLEYEATI